MIAFDTASTSTETNSNSKTWSHTCSGSDRFLIVAGYMRNIDVTGATYNGVTMTQVGSYVGDIANNDRCFMFILVNPASGTNSVQVDFNGSNFNAVGACSYTGVKQSGQPDNSVDVSVATTTTTTGTLTTVADNCWTFMVGLDGSQTAGTGTTKRQDVTGGEVSLFDSNGAITPAGSTSLIFTHTSQLAGAKMISFAPSITPQNSNFLMFM